MKREELTQQVVEDITKLQRSMHRPIWRGEDISKAQVYMLYMLYYHKHPNMKKLAEQMDISKSAITQIMEPLIEKGLVSRTSDPKDRRVAILDLTKKGHQTIKKLNHERTEGLRAAMKQLNDKELKQLYELHQKITAGLTKQKGVNE
jgi:DNA-binding MarR family transcriptional regulator